MVIQTANIVSGFVLSAPMLKKWAGDKQVHIEKVESHLNTFRGTIGVVMLVLGILALIERLGIVSFGFSLGSSFPQAIPAILSGLLLAPHLFEKYPQVSDFTKKIEPYAEWIGIVGITVGLGSILFGCMPPYCYSF